MPRDGFVTSGDLRIHYLDWGGDGPMAVLVHPSSFCADIWAPVAEVLSPRLRCVAMNLRGHGQSDRPAGPFTWDDLGADVVAILDQLDVRDALVVGHSRGGGASLLGTARRLDRVKSLILIEPNLIDRPEDWVKARSQRFADQARRRRAVFPDRETVYRRYRHRALFAPWRDEALWAYLRGGFRDREDGQVELACRPEVEAAYYHTHVDTDVWGAVADLRLPVLLVVGEHSDRFFMDTPSTRRFVSTAPDLRTTMLPGGHFIVQEHPEEIARVILSFAAETGVIPPE